MDCQLSVSTLCRGIRQPAKQYTFVDRNDGVSSGTHWCCGACAKVYRDDIVWKLIPLKEPCNCSLILCKECLKDAKGAVDF